MNLNQAQIIGRATKKPEIKSTPGGQSVTAFSIATNLSWTDKGGVKHEDVEYHNVVFWGKAAEVICQYVEKGQILYVSGRLRTREYEKQGNKFRTTEIIGESFQFGPKAIGKSETGQHQESQEEEINPENIPF